MKYKKILLVLVILIGIITLSSVYFMSKNLNNTNNEIKNQKQIKDSSKKDLDNNRTSKIIKNNNQEKDDKEKENNANSDNINNNNLSSHNQTEENLNENINSKYELKSLGNLQYYLYTPSNPTDNMPLIMYLHGGTNKRSSVESLLTTDGFPKYLYDGYYGNLRAYVVIPKLTNNYTGWADISDNLKNLIKSISTNYGIDTNKVSLTGHSMGGTGTYQVQVKLPNTFACIAPMSGSIRNTEENLNALSKTKVWAFVGTNDTIVDPNSTRTIIESLKNKGANVRLTEFDGTDHFDVPSLGYKNSEFINWLVNCSK